MIKKVGGRREQKPRFPFSARVLVSVRGQDEAHEEWSENLSAGGIFIRTQSPYPIGTTVEVELEVAAGKEKGQTIHCVGEVVWTKEFRDTVKREQSGMGIRFVSFHGDGQADLEALLVLLNQTPVEVP